MVRLEKHPVSNDRNTTQRGRFFCVDKTMKNELNQGMKGVLSHSGDGSCCANFTMNARDQNTEEPAPCVIFLWARWGIRYLQLK